MERRERFRGAMLGVAIGDALGAPYEGSPPRDPARLSGWEEGVPHALRYTDDTHMTLGTARSLIACEGDFDGGHMAETFASHYEAEPWRGYGAGPPRIFAWMRAGVPWEQAGARLFGGQGSFGNGAAMRAAPIGLRWFGDLERADEVARAAARITHTHPLGQEGAALLACAVAGLAGADKTLDPARFLAMLRTHARTDVFAEAVEQLGRLPADAPAADVIDRLGNGIEAHRSVPTAVYGFLRHPGSFSHAVRHAVALGGDADTIGSMTGALSGAYLGSDAIPVAWREAIEDGDTLCALADELHELAQRRS